MLILVVESAKIAETMSMYSNLQREAKDLRFPTASISGSNLKGKEIEKSKQSCGNINSQKESDRKVQLCDYTDTESLNFKFVHFY